MDPIDIGNNSKGARMVVFISEGEKRLADDKLSNVVPNCSPIPSNPQSQGQFCSEEDIDIKIEVMPSLEDMGIDVSLLHRHESTLENDTPPQLSRQDDPTPKPKPYACPICQSVGVERAFTKPSKLKAHVLYHQKTGRAILSGPKSRATATPTDQTEYTCSTCNNRVFTSKKVFQHHVNFHKYIIRKYGVDRPIAQSKNKITSSTIPIQDKYSCSSCQKEFVERKKYLEHRRVHLNRNKSGNSSKRLSKSAIPLAEEYTCSKCDKVYKRSSRDAYRAHLRRHVQLEEEEEKRKLRISRMRPDIPLQDEYHCDTCDRNFLDRLRYINHVKLHEGLAKRGEDRVIAEKKEGRKESDDEEEEDYYCQTCDKHFEHKIRFRGHMKYHQQLQKAGKDRPITNSGPTVSWKDSIPKDLESYACSTCPNRTFLARSSFISHLSLHRSLKRKGRDRPLLTKEEWHLHNSKASSCPICPNLTFPNVRGLREHEREAHPKEKGVATTTSWKDLVPEQDTYSCPTCPEREFEGRATFIGHLQFHRALSRKGIDRPILSRGQVTIHRKIQPRLSYHCVKCNKSFGKKATYTSHIRYHAILARRGEDRVIDGRRKGSWKDNIPSQDHYSCDRCPDRRFEDKKGYIGHLAYHRYLDKKGRGKESIPPCRRNGNIEQEEDMKCDLCDRVFTDTKIYRGHKAYHAQIRKKTGGDRAIGKKNEEISCLSGTRSSLDQILQNLNKYGCGCGQSFYFKDALLHHVSMAVTPFCGEVVKVEVEEDGFENFALDKEEENEAAVEVEVENQSQEGINDVFPTISQLGLTITQVVGAAESEGMEEGVKIGQDATMEFCSTDGGGSGILVNEVPDESESHNGDADSDADTDPLDADADEESEAAVVSPPANPPIQQIEESGPSFEIEEPFLALFHCEPCNSDSNSLTEYLRHQYHRHLVDQTVPLPCPFCALQFTSGSGLLVHCKQEHDGILPVEQFGLPCPVCAAEIQVETGAEMEHHFKQEHPKTVCRICNTVWSNFALLNKHIVETHLKRNK